MSIYLSSVKEPKSNTICASSCLHGRLGIVGNHGCDTVIGKWYLESASCQNHLRFVKEERLIFVCFR